MTPLIFFAVKKSPCLMVKLYFWELNPHVWWSKPIFTGYLWLLIMNFPIFDGPNMSRPYFGESKPLFRDWMLLPVRAPKFEPIWTLNQPTNLSWLANRPWFPISSSWAQLGPSSRRRSASKALVRSSASSCTVPMGGCSESFLQQGGFGVKHADCWGGFVSGHFQIKHVISSLRKTGSGAKVI